MNYGAHFLAAQNCAVQSAGNRHMSFSYSNTSAATATLHCSVAQHFHRSWKQLKLMQQRVIPKGHQIQQSNVTRLNDPDSRAQKQVTALSHARGCTADEPRRQRRQ